MTEIDLEARAELAAERLRDAVAERDAAVLALHDEGSTLREIGELVGLTHAGVARIVHRYEVTT